ncbi:MAG: hypothetical protein ACOXZ1_03250 [Patescibacteria group bacterium]|jgi:hypothetical protein
MESLRRMKRAAEKVVTLVEDGLLEKEYLLQKKIIKNQYPEEGEIVAREAALLILEQEYIEDIQKYQRCKRFLKRIEDLNKN